MTARRVVVSVVYLVALALPLDARKPALEEILARAGDYHASYVKRSSGVRLDEHYTLMQVTAGRMQTPMRFQSDVVMLDLNGDVISLRDPYLLDNVALRERAPRIIDVLREPTRAGWDRAQNYAAESHFRFVSDIVLALNDPTVALRFISKEMQPKLVFKLEGTKKLEGREVVSVGFKEPGTRETKFALGTRGNAAASGRFFIDPVTGAVQKTELWANSPTEAVVSTVTYGHVTDVDLWLPLKMQQTFEWKELNDVKSNRDVGAYAARLFFQVNAVYNSPTLTPIDLSKTRR